MDILDENGKFPRMIPARVVSAFCGAASALNLEYTLPGYFPRECDHHKNGRKDTGAGKESIQSFAAHNANYGYFPISTGMLEELSRRLVEGGYREDTPAAIVYKATWPDEKKIYLYSGYSGADSKREQDH